MSEVYGGQRLCECCGAVITADRRTCEACFADGCRQMTAGIIELSRPEKLEEIFAKAGDTIAALTEDVARLTKEKQEALELLDQFNGMATRYKECMEALERKARECEGLRGIMTELVRQFDKKQHGRRIDAPGHSHEVSGIWDSDNGELAGKPCAFCAVWREACAIHDAALSAGGTDAAE